MLHARRRHGDKLQVKAVHFCAFLQQCNRLFAKRRVVVHQRNFFALELVQSTFLFTDVLNQDIGAGPVASHQRKIPFESLAVLCNRQAIADREQRYFVGHHFFGQRKSDACGLGIKQRHPRPALQAFIAFHPTVGGVARLALFIGQFHAVDAAVAGVDHLQVVLLAVGPRHAIWRVRSGAVGQQRKELLLGLGHGAGAHQRCRASCQSGHGKNQTANLHACLLKI